MVDQGKNLIAGFTNDPGLLHGESGPVIVFGDHTRCFKYVDFPFCMGADGVKVLKPQAGWDPKFLYYYLASLPIPSAGYSRHFKFLKEQVVAQPPLEEQRRIAEVLDRADELRAKRHQALANLDDLPQSIFLEMFDEPATNRRGMELRTLGELAKLKSGSFLPASRMVKNGQHAVLGGNGISGYHDEYMFEEAKLVVGRVGAYCGCIHMSPPQSWVTDNALYVSELDPSVTITYLAHALKRASLNQYASQSGQPLISGSRVYPTPVLVPPIPLQRQFADRVNAVEMLKAKNQTSLAELDSLFASLQDRAFRGLL
ncbi:type I restriction enzyme, S subunit [Micromonospora chersina]|uniref:Type I restriction enzyme, S subunit n=1 Tax=Micromonospora chersina TaxID=47854 RepID=A0A1C6VJ48_9ACTN|nr:type I restriction enzyme, S subunit [Micromonospora chersina]